MAIFNSYVSLPGRVTVTQRTRRHPVGNPNGSPVGFLKDLHGLLQAFAGSETKCYGNDQDLARWCPSSLAKLVQISPIKPFWPKTRA